MGRGVCVCVCVYVCVRRAVGAARGLREIEELSYEDIARIAQLPQGTVMSRLSRARRMLFAALSEEPPEK